MKNILMLIGLGLITLIFLGSFTVNESENAIVVSQNHHTTNYNKPGLYFALPFYNTVNLIYMSNREAIVSIALAPESGNKYVKSDLQSGSNQILVDLLVNWHVANSSDYFQNLKKIGQVDFNKNLVDNILNSLLHKINGQGLLKLNQLSDILDKSVNIQKLGISLDSISIVSINFAQMDIKQALTESQSTVYKNNSTLDLQNKMIESAYYQAQIIKTAAEINQANKYDQIKKANPKFYNYFRLIDVYKTSAKDKLDVPAFDKLYHR